MKMLRRAVCCAAVLACVAGVARADDSPDRAAYKQKMHSCVTQMKTDHPEMNHDARRQACHKQLGPAPKAVTATPPAATPAPSTP